MTKSLVITLLALLTFKVSFAKQTPFSKYVQGEVLVKLANGVQVEDIIDFKVLRSFNTDFGTFAIIQTNDDPMSFIKAKKIDQKLIEYMEPNYILHTQEIERGKKYTSEIKTSGDPLFSKLWGLKNTGTNEPASSRGNSSPTGVAGSDINALEAWRLTKGSQGIKIAVIDTGVDYNHEDLRQNMWVNQAEKNGADGVDDDGNGYVDDIYGYDFANNDSDPMDGNGHGTHCSGTIAGVHDNGIGVKGVMAHAQIVAVKFLGDNGSGTLEAAVQAIDYATKVGVDIMSNSWGGGGFNLALYDAISRAEDAGIVFVAAAGNSAADNDVTPHYPSNYEASNVISVAANNYNDGLASFSCYGSDTVHIAAPGRNILSTTPGNEYQVYSGTSMATPHVSGMVGLYLALHGKTEPRDVKEALESSGVYNNSYGRKLTSGARAEAYNFLNNTVMPRPQRPNESDWQVQSVDLFESEHPYLHKQEVEKSYTVAGARYIRVKIQKLDLESGYDYLRILDGEGNEVEALTGNKENFSSDYIQGDTVTVKFESDVSVARWGFLIDQVEVIY